MSAELEPVEVMQADRDAAADFLALVGAMPLEAIEQVRAGKKPWQFGLVQAFARHRRSTPPSLPTEAMIEAFKAAYQSVLDLPPAASDLRSVRMIDRKAALGAIAAAREAALSAPPQQDVRARIVEEIASERRRQIEAEGWTPEHDDEHSDGAMALAAACYAAPDRVHWVSAEEERHGVPVGYANFLSWPWVRAWWKPKDRRRDLIRAAALILAEIERLDRALTLPGQDEGERT